MKFFIITFFSLFCLCSIFAKDKKSSVEDNFIEIPAYEFFGSAFSFQKDIVYKIPDVELIVNTNGEVKIRYHLEFDFRKILTEEQKERIQQAEKYDAFKNNYIVYAQTKKKNPLFSDIKIIKVENIPTQEDIYAEEARLEAKRIADEKRKAEKQEERQALCNKIGGYDNLPWGTTLEEFLQLVPIAESMEDEGCLVRYSRKGSTEGSKLIYKFFEGKLVGGETKYEQKPKDGVGDAINHRLVELYGNPSNVEKTEKHRVEKNAWAQAAYTETHLNITWNKSPTFKIFLDICVLVPDTKKDQFNMIMFINWNLETFTIYYDNPSMKNKIAAGDIKAKKEKEEAIKAQENAEKEAKRNELMKNLDL